MSADVKLAAVIVLALIIAVWVVRYLTRPDGYPPRHEAGGRKIKSKTPERIFRVGWWFMGLGLAFIASQVFVTYLPDMPVPHAVILVVCVVVIVLGFVWQPKWPWNQQREE